MVMESLADTWVRACRAGATDGLTPSWSQLTHWGKGQTSCVYKMCFLPGPLPEESLHSRADPMAIQIRQCRLSIGFRRVVARIVPPSPIVSVARLLLSQGVSYKLVVRGLVVWLSSAWLSRFSGLPFCPSCWAWSVFSGLSRVFLFFCPA